MMRTEPGKQRVNPSLQPPWRLVLHEVIFEADTPAGKGFDVILIISILASVMAVMLDSITTVRLAYG
jgi:voltage-gated potassium channel